MACSCWIGRSCQSVHDELTSQDLCHEGLANMSGGAAGQFRAQPTEAPLSWEGRVEPGVSGPRARVPSLEAWLAFLRRVLTDVQQPPAAA
jgi:hypothetical protein